MKLRLYFLAWFIFLALLLAPHMASAQITTVGVHTLSRHDPSHGANDINFGAFVSSQSYTVGAYYNSHRRMAYYAGWSTPEWHRLKASFVGVTGYFAPVTLIAIPSLKLYEQDDMSVWLSGSPVKITEDGQSVLHISIAWRLK